MPAANQRAVLDLGSTVLVDLAARRRRRRSGLCRDRLGRVARLASLGRRGFLALRAHALLEGRETLAEVAHELRDLTATAEQQQYDGQHDQPVPYAQATHIEMLPMRLQSASGRLWHRVGGPATRRIRPFVGLEAPFSVPFRRRPEARRPRPRSVRAAGRTLRAGKWGAARAGPRALRPLAP